MTHHDADLYAQCEQSVEDLRFQLGNRTKAAIKLARARTITYLAGGMSLKDTPLEVCYDLILRYPDANRATLLRLANWCCELIVGTREG